MSNNSSFDITAQVDLVEVKNAVEQVNKEISKRYDFKNSISNIEFTTKESLITVHTEDEYKLNAIKDIFNSKLIGRKLPVKAFQWGSLENAQGGTVRTTISIQQGIPQDKAKEIVKFIKNLNLKKVQASIQQDIVRVTGKDRDDLQHIIHELKQHDFNIFLDFENYR